MILSIKDGNDKEDVWMCGEAVLSSILRIKGPYFATIRSSVVSVMGTCINIRL